MPVKLKSAQAPTPSPTATPLAVKMVAVADLKEYGNNPRKNDAAVPRMVEQIKAFGFKVPVLVRGDRLVDGHLRLKAARTMGMTHIPAIDVGDMSEAEEAALRISINKTVEWAEWDPHKLDAEFKAILGAGLNLTLTGFDFPEISGIAEKVMQPLVAPALPTVTPTVPKSKGADAGTPADPAHVSITFHMTAENRAFLLDRLKAEQAKRGLPNPSTTLIAVMKDLA